MASAASVRPEVQHINELRASERELHWARTRSFMDERGLDALLIFGSDRFGADTFVTNDQPSMTVVFPRDGEMTATSSFGQLRRTTHFIGAERGEHSWVEDVRHTRSGHELVEVLQEKGLNSASIGVIGEGWVPYSTWHTVINEMTEAQFTDVTWDFGLMLMARTPADVECLREAAAIGEEACKAMVEVTRVGASEADFLAVMFEVFTRRGARTPMTMLSSGPDNFAWGPPIWFARPQPPRTFASGDVVQAELFPTFGGLESQQQIAVAIGRLNSDQERCATAARRSYEAGLEVIRPGITFGELCAAMERPVSEVNGWHLSPLVHPLNPILVPGPMSPAEKYVPELADRYVIKPSADAANRDFELQAGMGFAFQPNCCLGRYRVNVGGTVLVTESGGEELNEICNELLRV